VPESVHRSIVRTEPGEAVWWLALGRLPTTTGTRMLAPLLGVIAKGIGVSLVTAGTLIAAFELAGLTAPAAGWFVDRVGPRRALAVALGGFSGAAALAAISPNATVFVVGLVAMGLASNVYESAAVVWLAGATQYLERAVWMGRYELSWAGGLLIGVPIAGVVSLASWRLAFMMLAVVALAAWAALGRRLDTIAAHVVPDAAVVSAELVRSRRATVAPRVAHAVALFLSFGLICGASQLVIVVYGVWLEDRFGFSTAAIGAIAFLLGAGDLVANLANVRFTDRVGKARSAVIGAVGLALSAVVLAMVSDVAAAGVAALVLLIVTFEFSLLSSKPLLTELGWRRRGLGIGLGFAMSAVCRSIAAIAGTTLYEHQGLGGVALACAGTAVVAASIFHFAVQEPSGH
jgi:predicted MFS family arabinose efflux permease